MVPRRITFYLTVQYQEITFYLTVRYRKITTSLKECIRQQCHIDVLRLGATLCDSDYTRSPAGIYISAGPKGVSRMPHFLMEFEKRIKHQIIWVRFIKYCLIESFQFFKISSEKLFHEKPLHTYHDWGAKFYRTLFTSIRRKQSVIKPIGLSLVFKYFLTGSLYLFDSLLRTIFWHPGQIHHLINF